MKKIVLVFSFAALFLALVVLVASPNVKADPIPGEKIGIVLMHGKGGTDGNIARPNYDLRSAGALVEVPMMPWSKDRIYDKGYEESVVEIDMYVASLKEAGAKKIFVAGHSMGANATLGYAAPREGLSGAILLAYRHVPGNFGFAKKLSVSTERARRMIDTGKGEEEASFYDHSGDNGMSVYASANDLFSRFDPEGGATIPYNAPKVGPDTPILCIDGWSDPRRRCHDIMRQVHKNPKSDMVIINADHSGTPVWSNEVIVDWVRALECEKPWCGKHNPSIPADERQQPTSLKGYGRTNCTLEELLQSKCDYRPPQRN